MLREVSQLRLRHLLRTLPQTKDGPGAFAPLRRHLAPGDNALSGFSVAERPLDQSDLELPVSLGGLGMALHTKMAPPAYAALERTSDAVLESRSPLPYTYYLWHGSSEDWPCLYQMLVRIQYSQRLDRLSHDELTLLADIRTSFATRWVTILPQRHFQQPVSRRGRTRIRAGDAGFRRVAPKCRLFITLEYHQSCQKKARSCTDQHDVVVTRSINALQRHLQTVPGTAQRVESHVRWTSTGEGLTQQTSQMGTGELISGPVQNTALVVPGFSATAAISGSSDNSSKDGRISRTVAQLGTKAAAKRAKYNHFVPGSFHLFIRSLYNEVAVETASFPQSWTSLLPAIWRGEDTLHQSMPVDPTRAGARRLSLESL